MVTSFLPNNYDYHHSGMRTLFNIQSCGTPTGTLFKWAHSLSHTLVYQLDRHIIRLTLIYVFNVCFCDIQKEFYEYLLRQIIVSFQAAVHHWPCLFQCTLSIPYNTQCAWTYPDALREIRAGYRNPFLSHGFFEVFYVCIDVPCLMNHIFQVLLLF